MKPSQSPLTVHGFCAGCQQHDKRLTMVAPHRYRCDECGAREQKK
jgi:hypothetical protein